MTLIMWLTLVGPCGALLTPGVILMGYEVTFSTLSVQLASVLYCCRWVAVEEDGSGGDCN